MQRRHIHLTDRQVQELRQLEQETGLPIAEIIRRAIDEYLEKQRKAKQDKKQS